MKTTITEQNNELVAHLEGRLDTAAAVETEKALAPLSACEGKNVVLDCTDLQYISSSGLRLFLGVLKVAKAKGSQVYIAGLGADLQKIFAMTGFTNLFQFRN